MSGSPIFLILSYIGSIALVVQGLRTLNERILLSFGSKTRDLIMKTGEHPLTAARIGMCITGGFQSFSGLSVLLMSLINASLVSPSVAFAVLAGAEIGLAFPLWVLTFGGFFSSLGNWALPAFAIITPLSLVRKRPVARFGSGAFQFLLIFLGIELLKYWLPLSSEAPRLLFFVRGMAEYPFLFALMGFAFGVILSAASQSSGAVLVTALWLCWSGWLPLPPAIAMVFGSEIGVILTTYRASRTYGEESRKLTVAVSLLLLIFSFAGLLLVFPVEKLIIGFFPGAFYKSSLMPFLLSAVYTLWSLAIGLLALAIRPFIMKISSGLQGLSAEDDRTVDLPIIASNLPDSLEANLITTRHEIGSMAVTAHRMLMEVLNVSQDIDESANYRKKLTELQAELIKSWDRVEKNLTKMVRERTGSDQARDITAQIRVGRSLTLIGDSCVEIAAVLERIRRKRYKIHGEAIDELYAFIAKVLDFLKYDGDYLVRKLTLYDQDLALTMESQVDAVRDKLRKRVQKTLEKDEEADIRGELQFMEIVRYLELIGDDCLLIAQDIPRLR